MKGFKASKIFNLIENIYTSGMFNEYGVEQKRKVIFLNIFLTIGFIILIPSGYSAYLHNYILLAIINFGLAALVFPIALHLRMSHRTDFASIASVFLLSVLFIYLFVNGGVYQTGMLWLYIYPIFVLFLLGTFTGSIVILSFLAIAVLIHFVPMPYIIGTVYEDGIVYRFIFTFLTVFIITFYFEKVKSSSQKDLEKRNLELKDTIDRLKSTEKVLLEKEKFQGDVFNAIQNGLCIIDRDYKILDVNEWMKKYYSDKMPMVGKKCFDVFQNRNEICPWCPSKDTFLTKTVKKSLVPYTSVDGGWLEVTAYPMLDSSDKVIGAIEFVEDVTDKKNIEEKLRKNQANLVALIDNTKDLIWSVDNDYKIQIYNLSMKKMYESLYEIVPEKGLDMINSISDPEIAGMWKDHYDRALKGEHFKVEMTIELSDYGPIFMEFSFNPMSADDGTIIGVSCLGRNITDWKEYERSILESEREHRLLFTNAHDAILIFDPKDERILELNDRAAEIYGYEKSEILGNSLKEISKDIPQGESRIKILLNDEKPLSFQTTHYHKDGHEMTIEVNTSLVYYKGEKAVLTINRDITERIRIEKELKENEENFRTLSDESPNMICINQEGSIVYANKKFSEVMGYTKEEYLDSNFDFLSLVDEDSMTQFLNNYNKVYNEKIEIVPQEYKFIKKDQKHLDAIFSSRLIKYNNDNAVLGIITDISELKLAQEALKISQMKYKDLFESDDEARFIMNDIYISQCNAKAEELFGYSKEDLVNNPFYAFAPLFQEDDRFSEEFIHECVYEVINGFPQHIEWDIKRKDGKVINTEVTFKKLVAYGDKYHQAIIRDITQRKRNESELENYRNNLEDIVKYRTEELSKVNNQLYKEIFERKQTEMALRESEEHFKDLVEKAGIAIMMDNSEAEVTYYNNKFCELFGYMPEEIERMTIHDMVHPDDLDFVMDIHIRRMSGEDVDHSYEFKGMKKDGTDITVEVKVELSKIGNSIIGTRSYLWDITDRKEIENQLMISDQILQKAGTLVLVANDKAEIIYASPYLKTILGYAPDEILGRKWWSIYDDTIDDIDKEIDYTKKAAKGMIPNRDAYERELKTKNGDRRWIQWQDAIGINNTLIGVGIDITDRKNAIQMMKKAKDEAEQANRMKSQFIANVSHEIRTPLNGIIGFTELILNSNDVRIIHPQAQSIIRESETLLNLINDLLDHAKMEAGKTELEYLPIDLTNFIDDIVSSNFLKIKNKGIDLRVSIDEEAPKYVEGDYLRLRQVMMNLVSNAIKFTEKGYIEIGYELVATRDDTSKIVFFCIDTGIGIPEEKQQRIFESFIQADGSTTRKYGGTGLGTSISKLLIELMGGEIGLESQLGEGSTFWFLLEMKHSLPPLESEKDMKVTDELQYVLEKERKVKTSKILVVEDYEPNQEVARTHLESVGHNVSLASNGAIGVEFALSEKFDLILMDIQMPVMDGLTAAKTIREQVGPNKDSIIVALTANADDETLRMCSENGMNDLITKPIRRKEFLRIVDKWLFLSDSKKEKTEIEPDEIAEELEDEIKDHVDIHQFVNEVKEDGEDNNIPIVIEVALEEFGSREIVDKVIAQFIDNVSDQVNIIRDAINDQDYESCRREAHSIKGGAATLEALPLSKAAKDIEFACKNKEYDNLPMFYERFCNEFDRLIDFINTL